MIVTLGTSRIFDGAKRNLSKVKIKLILVSSLTNAFCIVLFCSLAV